MQPGISEGRGGGKAEGLAGLAQDIETVVELLRLCVGVVASPSRGEHAAGDQVLARKRGEELERVDGVVDAEGRVDDRHHDVELASGRVTRDIIGTGDRVDGPAELNLLTTLTGAVDVI